MSGHSKWSTIKRKKAANDARRGKIFTRLAREITIAARHSGDPEANFALRLAVDRARTANMPKENIERAIKRGTGELDDGTSLEEIRYEAYGPNGVAFLLEVVTDNRNRTLSEIKHALSRAGGAMAEPGAVSWQFEQKGYITVAAGQKDHDEIFLIAAEAGADDVVNGEEWIEIYTPREAMQTVQEALQQAGVEIDEARLEWIPKNDLELDPESARKVMSLVETLEELEDMQTVYSNLHVTDDLIAAFEAA